MIKKLIICGMLLAVTSPAAAGIFSNGSTSEDSLVLSVFLTDSLGNPSGTQADSFYLSVLGPSGDSLVTIAGVAATPGLNIDSIHTTTAGWRYIFSDAVADIDGAGRPGNYEIVFCAKDNAPEYVSCMYRSFQLCDENLNTQLALISDLIDSLFAVLDTLQNQDNWVAGEVSQVSAHEIMDSASNRGIIHYDSSGAVLSLGSIIVSDDIEIADSFLVNGSPVAMLTDTAHYQGAAAGLTYSGIDSLAAANPDHFFGPATGGSGSDVVTIYAIDTSGANQAVVDVKVSVKTLAGADYAVGYTSSGGYVKFACDATDTFLISGRLTGYVWPMDDTIAVIGTQSFNLFGYDIAPGTPAVAEICRIYGYFYGIDGSPVEGVTVTAQLTDGAVRYDNVIVSPYKSVAASDSTGYFYLDLIPSNELNPTGTRYQITAEYPAGIVLKKYLEVPTGATWEIDW